MIAQGRHDAAAVPSDAHRLTDEEIMEAIRDGDHDAVQLLVDRYWLLLASSIERMVGSRDTAEDIAQEVCGRECYRDANGVVYGGENAGMKLVRFVLPHE